MPATTPPTTIEERHAIWPGSRNSYALEKDKGEHNRHGGNSRGEEESWSQHSLSWRRFQTLWQLGFDEVAEDVTGCKRLIESGPLCDDIALHD